MFLYTHFHSPIKIKNNLAKLQTTQDPYIVLDLILKSKYHDSPK